ncbi:MAG: ATP-dependent zinc metalloprotease FtsH [Lachnospiraceae bacterium]|nr:ATP-dependent zinc metalloprotease FtsH [Lachnospiraceae bacterium]
MNTGRRGFRLWPVIMILVIFGLMFFQSYMKRPQSDFSFQNLKYMVEMETAEISSVEITQNEDIPTGSVYITTSDKREYSFYTENVEKVIDYLSEHKIAYTLYDVDKPSWLENNIMLILLCVIGVSMIFILLSGNLAGMGGANQNPMADFGKSRAKLAGNGADKITFRDVAGLKEEKEDLAELVDFLKDPGSYTRMGARVPKGVILVGPPGTGKTLLAKAVAGEADVPFFSISGSDFVEMFVGVGASRVRDLFDKAKKQAPCIVFIDEIDAVARRRGTGLGGSHDEREQTLNQLLVEMDGFGTNSGIIVMAATNRVDILDPAIMRPGRFDRKVAVGIPDIQEREEILKVHSRDKKLGDDVDLGRLARTTAGFTGADLENVMNEAAIEAVKQKREYIVQADVDKAFIKVGIGDEKKSRVISDKEKRITAYHEAGHAILFHVLPDEGPVYTVSIIPTGVGAAGYTMPLSENDDLFSTRGRMLQDITVALGGRAAEELVFDDITTGASEDIRHATKIARAMVTKFGMSDRVGLINYGTDEDEVFIGRDLAHARTYSDNVAGTIDAEIGRIIDECHKRATALLQENIDVLNRCADLLLEKERIDREEFEALF